MATTLPSATLCGALVLAAAGCAQSRPEPVDPAPPSAAAATTDRVAQRASPRPAGRWAMILHGLDERRDRAFTRGIPSLLDRVYVPGSTARDTDAGLVRAYLRRGLEIGAVRLRIDSVDVVRQSAGEATLRVVDRLRPVRVRADGGEWRALPSDRPTERVITLRRLDTGWRIARIRRVAG